MLGTRFVGPAPEKVVVESEPPALTVFVLDQSGSMSGKPREPLSRAIASAVSALPDDVLVSVVAVESEVRITLEPTPVGEVLLGPDMWVGRPGGGTSMLEALIEVRRLLRSAGENSTSVILYSDGHIDCAGIPELVADLRASGATISTLALAPYADGPLRQIAAVGGGSFYPAEDAKALPTSFARAVKHELPPVDR